MEDALRRAHEENKLLEQRLQEAKQGSTEVGMKEQGSTEVGMREQGSTEMGMREQRSPEVGMREQASTEVGMKEQGSTEVGMKEQGSTEVGMREQKSTEVGMKEQGSTEVDMREQGSTEVGMREQGSTEVGMKEQGSTEVDMREQGSTEVGMREQESTEDAVHILKSTQEKVMLKVEKNAISNMGAVPAVSPVPSTTAPAKGSTTRTVVLYRPVGDMLGFVMKGGHAGTGIFISLILPNSVADKSNQLKVGDRILEVNNQDIRSATREEAAMALMNAGTVVVLLVEFRPEDFSEFKNKLRRSQEEASARTMTAPSPPLEPNTAPAKGSTTRTVVLNRPVGEVLGFRIAGGQEEGTNIFIFDLLPNSVADKSNQLKVGDCILEVNHQDIRSATHEEAVMALKNAGTVITLLVEFCEDFADSQNKLRRSQEEASASPMAPSPPLEPTVVKQFYVRALFDYDSSEDRPSLGLSFKNGDILHILNGSDEEWWQAAAVNSQAIDGATGLVPSKKRIKHCAQANKKNAKFTKTSESSGLDWLPMKLPFIRKVSEASVTSALQSEEPKSVEEHIPTFESVKLKQRPVLILGPLKEEINRMLVQEFPDKFEGCVPHTTRPPRDGEVDGKDYHFVQSFEQMEMDIQADLFIEAGRYKDNLYGTSLKAVQEVAEQGKHCILVASGYNIRRLQLADLHPIVICIRPNSWEVIHAVTMGTQEQCQQTLEKGVKIEQEFVEYFTSVVSGDSVQDIYAAVKTVIQDQSGSHIWVPTNEPLP